MADYCRPVEFRTNKFRNSVGIVPGEGHEHTPRNGSEKPLFLAIERFLQSRMRRRHAVTLFFDRVIDPKVARAREQLMAFVKGVFSVPTNGNRATPVLVKVL